MARPEVNPFNYLIEEGRSVGSLPADGQVASAHHHNSKLRKLLVLEVKSSIIFARLGSSFRLEICHQAESGKCDD